MDLVSSLKLNSIQPKGKLRIIIYFIIIVGATISAFHIWKSHLQNPSTAAKIACSVAVDRNLCFTSISSLQRNSSNYSTTTNTSKIFALSLHVAINELSEMIPFLETLAPNAKSEWTIMALRSCEDGFNDSRSILSKSLALIDADPNENYLKNMRVSTYLRKHIFNARENVDKCSRRLLLTKFYDEHKTENEVQKKMKQVWCYVDNSLQIFCNMDEILSKLNPRLIGSIVNTNYITPTVVLGLSPYFFLVVLIFLMVKSMYY